MWFLVGKEQRFLITGGQGFIGAWIIKLLLNENAGGGIEYFSYLHNMIQTEPSLFNLPMDLFKRTTKSQFLI